MDAFQIVLITATFLCSLVAGFLFAFAVVVMPGISRLDDRGFIRSFQAIDGVIQDNQVLFILVWLGSALALIAAAILGFIHPIGTSHWMIAAATAAYLIGVQLPTIAVNVPLNNRLQTPDVKVMDDEAARAAREAFEVRWNRSNIFRTVVSCAVVVLLLVILISR